jgi:cytochrome c peroxidase
MKAVISQASVLILLIGTGFYLASFKNNNYNRTLPSTSAELGAILFKDKILSGNKTVSCASCHNPDFAFADTAAFSRGVNGHLTGRNTPTAMYLQNSRALFWDGRAASLEQQASGPITNKHEMNLNLAVGIKRLNASAFYLSAFKKIYGRRADSVLLVRALADYERTLNYYDSPYDRWLKGNDTAMNDAAIRGFDLFFRKNSCGNSACHRGENFSSDSLVNIGIFDEKDRGLFDLTKNHADVGKFKSPTLRNVALTAPYMHNGKHKTLTEVIEYYNDMKNFPLDGNTHADVKEQREKPLTKSEINDMVEFLKALTDYRFASAPQSY